MENELIIARVDGGAVELDGAEPMGPVALRGMARPMQVFRLTV
jgi:hypothetical protein